MNDKIKKAAALDGMCGAVGQAGSLRSASILLLLQIFYRHYISKALCMDGMNELIF